MAIETVDLPMKHGDFPIRFLYVYQVGYFPATPKAPGHILFQKSQPWPDRSVPQDSPSASWIDRDSCQPRDGSVWRIIPLAGEKAG